MARITDTPAIRHCAATSSVLRSKMSASAPEAMASSMIGIVLEAWTSAISVALSVSCVISQAAPTAWTSPPKLDTRVALQSMRKSRWRNGARAEGRGAVGSDKTLPVSGLPAA